MHGTEFRHAIIILTANRCIRKIEILAKGLKVIDGTAAALCRDYPVPMQIFDLGAKDSIYRAMQGLSDGTRITAQI